MTDFRIERFTFDQAQVRVWGAADPRHRNWPVVYVMSGSDRVYVGESLNAEARMRQHLDSRDKDGLSCVRVVLDETFNKSVCLDLESFLIRLFAGDGRLTVLNHNAGITDADYYDRAAYRQTFDEIFDELRTKEHLFQRTIPQIVNSDLFKFSPFKALSQDQAAAVENILEGLFEVLEAGRDSTAVVSGEPGTGKTIVAIYLMKLLEDIRGYRVTEPPDMDSLFGDFFTPGHPELLARCRIGLVVPQQSLRESVSRVFAKTPGLGRHHVLTPFDVGRSEARYDILLVDEAHRLNQRANQPSGPLNRAFADINRRLFGDDDPRYTQLDWIRQQSRHTILMLDDEQSVRPADLPGPVTRDVLTTASAQGRLYRLRSQMRIRAHQDYVGYIRSVLSDDPPTTRQRFDGYDLRFFTDIGEMRREIRRRDEEHGLARMVAGYAWEWRSKRDPAAFDIVIDGERFRWNSTQRDWINSPGAVDEVGSIHTVQGYDLNTAGVIIGNDLRYDLSTRTLSFDRAQYHDKKGRENNRRRGIVYTDEDLLRYVRNIYAVLLTRGIRGTYLYVCDPALREHLQRFF